MSDAQPIEATTCFLKAQTALAKATNIAGSICPVGRTMQSTPIKPTTVAVQRRMRTASPRKITVTMMDHSGLV